MKALIILFAGALCGAAVAGDDYYKDHHKSASSEKFASLDKNKDEKLSKTELQAEVTIAKEFDAIDANSDGYVSKPEYIARVESGSRVKETQYE
jgi:Ca2+-binding EF-hand superfamily protein